ncbi:MAG: PA14 domain-containing protein, partial [Phenylobacterium sp.]
MIRAGFLIPALAALVLAATDPATAAGQFQQTADGVVVTPDGGPARRVRLQVMGPRIIRVTAVPTERLDLPASLAVTAQPQAGGFKVTIQGGKVVLTTAATTAEVSLATGAVDFRDPTGRLLLAEHGRAPFTPETLDGKSFYRVTQAFNPATDEGFYGLGQHQNGQMNYNGEDVELAQYNRVIAIPFLLSTRGYGLLWDNNGISRFGDPKPYGLASRDLKFTDAAGKAGGFTARYYVAGALKLTRTEGDINYQFLKDQPGFPADLKDAKDKRVVWEGSVTAPVGGVQRFKLYSSDYAKVWVDGKLVIDRWRQNWNPWYHNFDVPMAAGSRHKVRVEWKPDGGFIALLHNNPMPAAERHSLTLTSDVAHAIDYYFVAGETLDQVVAGYRQLTGKAVLAPRWAYG